MHNLSDTASLGVSLAARKLPASAPIKIRHLAIATPKLSGIINLVTLVIISLFLVKQGTQRFYHPRPIDGWIMFGVAFIGLAGNFITAFLLYKSSDENINIRSAYIHILSDGLSSIGVVIAGWLIL